jgi:hypothetical protein
MQWEELDLFRRCEEMAATGHVMIIDSNLASAGDPVFGEKHTSEFKRLLKSVEQSLTASRTKNSSESRSFSLMRRENQEPGFVGSRVRTRCDGNSF